ncbi:RUS family member 1 isoform X6 [Balaenoptera acutorostrata]|uniref:RUS family member 1 isoform X6 n=1 Tax=Balaenoptera acutorostrata TaxID=9767 RepID=A0A384AGQ7_BALAC|nr:RUS family member 1 isoform X6 [Balaenoptera acutorostrata]
MSPALRPHCAPSSSAPGRPGAAAPPPTGACSGRPGGGAGGRSPGPSQRNPEDEMGAKGWLPARPSHLFPGSWLSSCLRASPIASARTICPTSCGIPCRFNWHAGPHHLCLVDGCIVGVAGGATRAALTMHQARRNNMADVSAKDGSQETLVSLAGLLVSLLMLPLVSDCPSLSLGCFFFLTALHIYANYRAVRALVIETLNERRLWLVLKHFLQRGEVLGPASANQMEPLWTGFWPSLSLSLGVPLHRVTSSVFELQKLVEGHQEPYLLRWDQSQNQVQVVLSQVAGPETILRAATHGLVLGALQGDGPLPGELEGLRNRVRAGPEKESCVIVRETHQVLDKLFPKFLKGLQDVGWTTEKHQLEVDEWRATWLLCPEKKLL